MPRLPPQPANETAARRANDFLPRLRHRLHGSILRCSHPERGGKSACYALDSVALLIYEEKSMNKWMGFQWV